MVQARTGTGKTAAFGLPIVDHIVKRAVKQPQALVLCPTRELAVQVSNEVERLGKRKNVQVTAIYGGAPMQRQIDAIDAGAQVIVGTPGRVLDHLRRGTLSPRSVRLLVLDECDEMLSMGFERELTAILEQLPPERQTLLFSATMPPDIDRIARTKLKSPEIITLSGDHIGALEIQHFVYMIASDKLRMLVRILEVENPESAIVFCNTREETERVAQAIARQGFDADWLNGDLPQSERESIMVRTREGKLRFLVATDVAARGIDISHLTHVINYDFPQETAAYVHRTGRTGRAGRTGTAISLITPQEIGGLYFLRLQYKIRPIERQIPSEGEMKTRAEADLVAMLAEAFLPKGTHPDDLALARRLLSHDQADAIVAGLLRDHLGARPTAREEAAAMRRSPRPARVSPGPSGEGGRKPAQAAEARAAAPARREETPGAPQAQETPARAPSGERDFGRGERDVRRGEREGARGERDFGRGDREGARGDRRGRRDEPGDVGARPGQARGGIDRRPPAPVQAPVAAVDEARAITIEPQEAAAPREAERAAPPVADHVDRGERADRADRGELQRRGDRRANEDTAEMTAPEASSAPPTPRTATPWVAPREIAASAPRPMPEKVTEAEPHAAPARDVAPEAEGSHRERAPEAQPRLRTHRSPEPARPGRPDPGGRKREDVRLREGTGETGERGATHPRHARPALDRRPPVSPGRGPAPMIRHADFATWQPPEEEGDDEPILGEAVSRSARRPGGVEDRREPERASFEAEAPFARQDEGDRDALPEDFVEIYINVGRRDGARASDFQRLLVERAGLGRNQVQRIRVRERNAFVSVRKDELARAIGALNGAAIGGRTAIAEQARDRASSGGAPDGEASGSGDVPRGD
jgi:ATP-dependent RNA helicase DeaD